MMTSLEERTMQQKLDAVKWDMLNEWAQTRKAPQHAAWMHEKPTGQP
jgi:lactoylglutathione lyase